MIRAMRRPGCLRCGCLAVQLVFLAGCQGQERLSGEGQPPGDASVGQILSGWRPTLARLDPAFPHVPYRPEKLQEERRRRRHELARLESRLGEEESDSPTLSGALALTWLDLVWEKAGRAVDRLQENASLHAEAVPFRHALAAAFLERFEKSGHASDLVRALENVDGALQLEPGLHAAAFNRALILDRMVLDHDARQAWRSYLQRDPRSPWSTEARQRLGRLEARLQERSQRSRRLEEALAEGDRETVLELARPDSQFLREYAERSILVSWARSRQNGDIAAAADHMQEARIAAWALQQLRGRNPVSAAVAELDRAPASDQPADRLDLLAKAHLALREGEASYRAFRLEEAKSLLSQAGQGFTKSGSALAVLPRYHLAVVRYRTTDFKGALKDIKRLELRMPQASSFPSLKGRIYWMRGMIRLLQDQPVAARRWFLQAEGLFKSSGETRNLASIYTRLSDTHHYTGNSQMALAYTHAALKTSLDPDDSQQRYTTVFIATHQARARGDPALALYFQREAERLAQHRKDPRALVLSRLLGAEIHLDLEEADEAWAELRQARDSLPPDRDQQWIPLLTRICLAEGRARLRADPQGALASLNRGIAHALNDATQVYLPELLRVRAQAHLTLNNADLAERDLLRGIDLAESQRDRIADKNLQIAFFDQRRRLFEDVIDFQLDNNRPESALASWERFRTNALLDAFSLTQQGTSGSESAGSIAVGPTLESLARSLPQGVTLLEYALLADRTGIWMVQPGRIRFFETQWTQHRFESVVSALIDAIVSQRPIDDLAAALHEALIGPALPWLPKGEQLVIVPDKCLHALPFAALINAQTGRYLIEDFTLLVAPSLRLYLEAAARYRQRDGSATLIVGNPAFDRNLFPQLRDLPGAAVEARAIAALYPLHRLLLGNQAQVPSFLEQAGRHAVIHLGAHAVRSGRFSQYPHLVFAPTSQQERGILYAYQIGRRRFERTRLVVLAACGNPAGKISASEGPFDLARPFLAAGVPAVVANLWELADRASVDFFQVFHQHLSRGETPPQALRSAQLHFYQQGRPEYRQPASWAGFHCIGGVLPKSSPATKP